MATLDSVPSARLPAKHRWLWVAFAAWIVALGCGLKMLAAYEFTPGAVGFSPSAWPAKSSLTPDGLRPTLVVFLHPQCPCSRATVAELAQLMAEYPNQFTVVAFVFSPASEVAAWSQSDLAEWVAELPGVRVQVDPEGRNAKIFGALTSGQVLVFGRHGDLQFSGGITGSRGHRGDNAGRRAAAARLTGREALYMQMPVFGCSLSDEPMATSPSS